MHGSSTGLEPTNIGREEHAERSPRQITLEELIAAQKIAQEIFLEAIFEEAENIIEEGRRTLEEGERSREAAYGAASEDEEEVGDIDEAQVTLERHGYYFLDG